MAKSIRSKVKKRNRTLMRKTYGDPFARRLQAKCNKVLLESAGNTDQKLGKILRRNCARNPVQKEVPKYSHVFKNPCPVPSTGEKVRKKLGIRKDWKKSLLNANGSEFSSDFAKENLSLFQSLRISQTPAKNIVPVKEEKIEL
mmetsp:Transcript_7778/g.11742  ORF Transcript_7778/g.11742 Transcript_7778/m.11742 type:complete len:143 (+) Transcript_7778:50-478(+)